VPATPVSGGTVLRAVGADHQIGGALALACSPELRVGLAGQHPVPGLELVQA
jgi:hypothetical protein